MKPLTRKEMLLNAAANGTLDNFEPATREEVFTKEAFANAGGGVTSWNDLTDKPFGEEVEVNVLWEQTGIVNMASSEEGWVNNFSANTDIIVEVNGEKYSTNTGEYAAPDMFSYGYHFNVQINDTVRVYFDMCVAGATSSVNIVGDDTGAYDICIYTETSNITPLDPKYLPVMTVEMRRNADETVSCNKTFDELYAYIKNGGRVEALFFYSSTSSSPTAQLHLTTCDPNSIRFSGASIGFAGDGTLEMYQIYAVIILPSGSSAWGRHHLIAQE